MMKTLMGASLAVLLTVASAAPAEARDGGHPGRPSHGYDSRGYRGERDHRGKRDDRDYRDSRGERYYRSRYWYFYGFPYFGDR
jgi:hypothetical protein